MGSQFPLRLAYNNTPTSRCRTTVIGRKLAIKLAVSIGAQGLVEVQEEDEDECHLGSI